jgi:hypothetical protein
VPQLNKPVPTYGFSEVSAPLPQTSSLIQKTPFGTYCAEITKASPACIVILIDQSEDMGKLFIANYKLKDFAAEIANRLIQSIVGACEGRQQDVKSWFRVALIKYAEAVSPAWERDLSGRDLVSAEELPLGSRLIQNSSGQFKEVWLNAAAAGSAKMETAFEYATDIASSFVTQYPHCYPPIVVNITASSLDQSALVAAEKLKTTLSSDGNTLLFNFFITPSSPSVIFPDYKEVPKVARAHFEISSVLPKKMLENAASSMSQYFFKGTRGLAVNAHADMIPKLLDVGDKNSR